jgi:hypothetical protein
LQSFLPSFYKSPAPSPSCQAGSEPISTMHATGMNPYWTLYRSNEDETQASYSPPSAVLGQMSRYADLPPPSPAPGRRGSDGMSLRDDVTAFGGYDLPASDDKESFEPLDHRIAWDQLI